MDLTGHVPRQLGPMLYGGLVASAVGGPRRTVLAGMLMAALWAGDAEGQPGGLFQAVSPAGVAAAPGSRAVPDSLTLRRRLVSIDFGQLTPPVAAAAGEAAPSGVLQLNLFDDASFTGLVERVAPTFSGGYSLSGRLAGVEMGTVTLVVNGEVVAGTVRTPEGTYRIRPAGVGLHAGVRLFFVGGFRRGSMGSASGTVRAT